MPCFHFTLVILLGHFIHVLLGTHNSTSELFAQDNSNRSGYSVSDNNTRVALTSKDSEKFSKAELEIFRHMLDHFTQKNKSKATRQKEYMRNAAQVEKCYEDLEGLLQEMRKAKDPSQKVIACASYRRVMSICAHWRIEKEEVNILYWAKCKAMIIRSSNGALIISVLLVSILGYL